MAESSTTSLDLPASLPYPIRLSRILVSPTSTVKRGTPLFEYTFTSESARKLLAKGGGRDESGLTVREWDMAGTFESRVEGTVERWEGWVEQGTTVERKYAGRPVIWLEQPCTHPVQLHGMCAICGTDLTSDDYLSRPAEEQAGPSKYQGSFEMSHDALGVTVSTNEAKRLENMTRDTLLRTKRLSLIVDLDQTIIHTTVDPTVGEWMTEMDEAESSEDGTTTTRAEASGTSTTPPGSPGRTNKGKEKNPNAYALQDVARFQLPDDLPPGYKAKVPDRNYYTKPRPGLKDFLERMNNIYEMHVYTMGTRSYAEAICNIVDSEGRYFGGRIISRDENRNFNSKNLKRLFPTDQSMVVVIDDRADVWGDIPNLVKVVPYDFFIGIGDINSAFLPPSASPPSTASATSPMPVTPPEEAIDETASDAIAQTKMLDAVSEERPLAKLQENLEQESTPEMNGTGVTGDEVQPEVAPQSNGTTVQEPPSTQVGQRRPLLNDNDSELNRVGKILGEIHRSFYRAYSRRNDKASDAALPMGCDVEVIVPDIKSRVLQGCTIVFSGVIPKHQRPEQSEIFTTAETFGARPMIDVSHNMTHCVTAALGTEKTHRSLQIGAFVVWFDWFQKSIALWERQDEREYMAIPEAGPSTVSRPDTPQIQVDDSSGSNGSDGVGNEVENQESGQSADVEMNWEENDDLFGGKLWDENDDADLQAFLEGSSDYEDGGTEAGDTDSRMGDDLPPPSPPVTAPGSPSKKRVRYADEESLPLETFRDPPDNADGSESPPRKRLLLEAPTENDHVPPEHRYQWRGKMKREQEEREKAERDAAQAGNGDGEEDLFAQMLEDSMGD